MLIFYLPAFTIVSQHPPQSLVYGIPSEILSYRIVEKGKRTEKCGKKHLVSSHICYFNITLGDILFSYNAVFKQSVCLNIMEERMVQQGVRHAEGSRYTWCSFDVSSECEYQGCASVLCTEQKAAGSTENLAEIYFFGLNNIFSLNILILSIWFEMFIW